MNRVAGGFRSVGESGLLEIPYDTFAESSVMDVAGSESIASLDDLVATNLYEIDSLGITRLKTD